MNSEEDEYEDEIEEESQGDEDLSRPNYKIYFIVIIVVALPLLGMNLIRYVHMNYHNGASQDFKNLNTNSHLILMSLAIAMHGYALIIPRLTDNCCKRLGATLHGDFHLIASFMIILGITAAYQNTSKPGGKDKKIEHFGSYHGQIGFMIVLLVALQIVFELIHILLPMFFKCRRFIFRFHIYASNVMTVLLVTNASNGIIAHSTTYSNWIKSKSDDIMQLHYVEFMILSHLFLCLMFIKILS